MVRKQRMQVYYKKSRMRRQRTDGSQTIHTPQKLTADGYISLTVMPC